jgi:hypothetical protein
MQYSMILHFAELAQLRQVILFALVAMKSHKGFYTKQTGKNIIQPLHCAIQMLQLCRALAEDIYAA